MLLNDLKYPDNLKDDIIYKFENGNIIKLGTFEFRPEYKHVEISIIGVICIEYEGDNGEFSSSPNMYWVKIDGVCDRYHGFIRRDDAWVNRLFELITPFTDDINCRLEEFFRIAFDRAQNMPGKQTET